MSWSLLTSALYMLLMAFSCYNMVANAVVEQYNMVLAYGVIWYFGNMVFGGLFAVHRANDLKKAQASMFKALTNKLK